jgi:hypothetical protein
MEAWGYREADGAPRWERLVLARWIRSQTKVSVKWLAEQLGMETRGGMSNGIYLAGLRLETERSLRQRWQTLEKLRL